MRNDRKRVAVVRVVYIFASHVLVVVSASFRYYLAPADRAVCVFDRRVYTYTCGVV